MKYESLFILAIYYIDGRLAYRVYKARREAERRREELRQRLNISKITLNEQFRIPI